MTIPEMITEVKGGVITDELINALVEFMWDYDPYGILDEYGHLDDEGVREQLAEEVRYRLTEDVNLMLDDLEYAVENCGESFRENY